MNIKTLLAASLIIAAGMGASFAQTPVPLSPKAQLDADAKAAAARYESDKKLCSDETQSAARLQCRRDAKTEYDKALAAAHEKMRVASLPPAPKPAAAPVPVCSDCGKVVSVSVADRPGEGGPVGVIAGGVGGAILGNQVGGGLGKDLATIAGAVGGAYAGKKIEERVRTVKVWTVNVQYADNSTRNFEFREDPGYKAGDAVRNSGNTIVRP